MFINSSLLLFPKEKNLKLVIVKWLWKIRWIRFIRNIYSRKNIITWEFLSDRGLFMLIWWLVGEYLSEIIGVITLINL
jgi:hypothetical protein